MKMHETKNGIPEKKRVDLANMLSPILAALSDLYNQSKNAHWNVKGMQFIALHELFDEIAEEIEDLVDTVAERITALGGTAYGTVQFVAKNTPLTPYPTDIFSGKEHLVALSHRIAQAGEIVRQGINYSGEQNDLATQDVLIEVERTLDKKLWFLEAHLQD